ncbi:MAG TPA: MFS transporter [Bacteroidota bacterium]|nr:MFS transporter [Bacteroidota bacterium]
MNSPLPAPPKTYRWVVLAFLSLAMFGNYYVYDSIPPLADVLKSQLGFSDSNIGLLNAIYSFPNIIMVLVGGMIIDRIGPSRSAIVFAGVCLVGASVTAISPRIEIMAAGRLCFGLGAESLIVAITTAIAKWFKGKELSFAFGLNLTIARLGSVAVENSPSWMSDAYFSWRAPLLVAVAFAGISLVGGLTYWFLESKARGRYQVETGGPTDKVVFRDIVKFDRSYWLVVGLCVAFYSAIFPFKTFAIKMFIEAHGATRQEGGFYLSMLDVSAMVLSPIFGIVADKIGRRALIMTIGSALFIPVFLLLAFTHTPVFIPMALMGVSFSLIPTLMWPSVAYLVDQPKLGTAYGLMTLIQNVGFFSFNLLIGSVNDWSGASSLNPSGYVPGLMIFASLSVAGLVFAYFLRRTEVGTRAHGLETTRATSGG